MTQTSPKDMTQESSSLDTLELLTQALNEAIAEGPKGDPLQSCEFGWEHPFFIAKDPKGDPLQGVR